MVGNVKLFPDKITRGSAFYFPRNGEIIHDPGKASAFDRNNYPVAPVLAEGCLAVGTLFSVQAVACVTLLTIQVDCHFLPPDLDP